jgi:hypothetical protein
VQGRDPGTFVLADGAHHVERCAIAGIGIGDQRDVTEHTGDHTGTLGHLGLGEQADVRQAEPGGGHARAGQVGGGEFHPGGQGCGDAVEHPGRDGQRVAVQ